MDFKRELFVNSGRTKGIQQEGFNENSIATHFFHLLRTRQLCWAATHSLKPASTPAFSHLDTPTSSLLKPTRLDRFGSERVSNWNRDPEIGPTIAKDAYIGAPFNVNRQYAEKLGSRWVILSAKYGFIDPDYLLPGPYEVTFKKKSTGPVETKILAAQVVDQKLDQFDQVVGLGGKEYRIAIKEAYSASDIEPEFPFAGLPIGKAMRAAKVAIES